MKPVLFNCVMLAGLTDDTDLSPSSQDLGYDVEVCEAGSDRIVAAMQVGVVETAQVAVSPEDGKLYRARIRSRRGVLVGDWAELGIDLIGVAGAMTGRPSSPLRVRATPAEDGGIVVTWEHSDLDATVAASGFRIYADGTLVASPDVIARRASVSGLTPGDRHVVRVQAVSTEGVEDGGGQAVLVVPRTVWDGVSPQCEVRQA